MESKLINQKLPQTALNLSLKLITYLLIANNIIGILNSLDLALASLYLVIGLPGFIFLFLYFRRVFIRNQDPLDQHIRQFVMDIIALIYNYFIYSMLNENTWGEYAFSVELFPFINMILLIISVITSIIAFYTNKKTTSSLN